MSSLTSSSSIRAMAAAMMLSALAFVGATALSSRALAVVGASLTDVCEIRKVDRENAKKNNASAAEIASIQAAIDSACTDESGKTLELSEYNKPAAASDLQDINSFDNGASKASVDIDETKETVESKAKAAGQDANARYAACKTSGAQLYVACRDRASQSVSGASSKYSELMAGLNGSNFENSCNGISNYTSQAQYAANDIRTICTDLHKTCLDTCNGAKQVYDTGTRSGRIQLAEWAEPALQSGLNQCARIGMLINDAQALPAKNTSNLKNACNAAKQNKQDTKTVKKDEADDESSNGNIWNQAAAAVPAIMSALNPQPLPLPTTGVDGSASYQPIYQNTTGMMPSVSKGMGGTPSTSGTNVTALPEELDLGAPKGEKGQKQLPQQQAGGTGGVGGGGGGPAAQAKGGGRRGGSSIDTNVYTGYFGGGGPAGRFKTPGDDPSASGRGKANLKPGSDKKLVDINRFRPTWYGRRDVATVTGPDGITGPHTNIFTKVRVRYSEVPIGVFGAVSLGN